jgi:hypothetical protein
MKPVPVSVISTDCPCWTLWGLTSLTVGEGTVKVNVLLAEWTSLPLVDVTVIVCPATAGVLAALLESVSVADFVPPSPFAKLTEAAGLKLADTPDGNEPEALKFTVRPPLVLAARVTTTV